MGLANDTHSDAAQFSYLATTFYVAYFVFELPSGYLVQRLPLAKYLGANGKICSQFQLYTNLLTVESSHRMGHYSFYQLWFYELRFTGSFKSIAGSFRVCGHSKVCASRLYSVIR
jgi:hypothetical protein